jgi:two-component system sensor histidine kinase VicK
MDFLQSPLFQSIFNQLPQPCILVRADNPRFTIVAVNQVYKVLTGDAVNTITGESIFDLFTTDNLPADGGVLIHNGLTIAVENNEATKSPLIQYSERRTNGVYSAPNWWQFELLPVTDADGKVGHILITMHRANGQNKESAINHAEALQNEQLLNEELISTNEELTATNEELQQSQESLARLNDELESRVEKRTKALSLSEAKFRGIFEQSPLALCVLTGRDLVIESANELILKIWGKTPVIVGQPLAVVLPELEGQPFLEILDEVFTTGKPFRADESRATQIHNGKPAVVFVDFVYSPLADETGRITSIMVSAIDVTERAVIRQSEQQLNEELTASNEELSAINEELSQSQQSLQLLNTELEERVQRRTKALAESEARFRSIIEQAPLGICLFSGPEQIVEIVNQNQLKFWGKTKKAIGKPHTEVIPGEGAKPYNTILQNVYKSGLAYKGYESEAMLEVNGIPQQHYFNFIYEPLKDENGVTNKVLLIADDVTDTVLTRKELEKAQDLLKLSIDAADIGTWNADLVTGELTMSERTRQIQGIPEDTIITLSNSGDVILPEHRERFSKAVNHAIQTRGSFNEDLIIEPLDGGDIKWLKSMGKAYYDEKGTPLHISGTLLDITEQVLSRQQLQELNEELSATNEELAAANEELLTSNEEIELNQKYLEKIVDQLTESEGKLRYMLADAPIAIALLTGRELTVEAANKKVLEAWGKDNKIIGKPLKVGIPELVGQSFLQLLDDVFTSGEPYYGNEVKALLEKEGVIEEVYSNFVYHPLKNDQGKTTSIVLVANVITEQVMARKKVEEAEEMMRFALEAANLGTWFIQAGTMALKTTARLKKIYGYEAAEEMTYEQAIGQVTDDYKDKITTAINNAIANGGDYDITYTMRRFNDQQLIWLRSLGRLNHDDAGKLTTFSGVVMDITEQKQDELRKNDFIGMVSHELKTPLTSLSAYVQMLYGKAQKSEDTFTSNALDKVNIQVKKMGNMINGFLNVSRLESGKIILDMHDFDLGNLVKDIIDETKLTISAHQITLQPCGPVSVYADEDKISSVISNLLSNAVKYSAKGTTISVTCKIVNNMAQISVRDQGIGINPEDTEKLFERYYRVVTPNTKHISGFGIGLYLSAEIIHRHNGKIWVESELGKGATFYFSLPIGE